jgi:sterol desaturase/sphingolipid hydroxylase (fatty acid hydroxylase superfamily)
MIYIYINLIFSFLIFGSYTAVNDYTNYKKIKAKNNMELNKIYYKIIPYVLSNVFLLSLPAVYYFDKLLVNPNYHLLKDLPLAAKYITMPLLIDIMFYTMHRLFHSKYLYYFHKRHHELVSPVGIGSFYMSPVEFYGAIVIPIFAPLVLLGANNFHSHLWITFTIYNGICVSHSNTKNLSEFHDYHHNSKNTGFRYNFGIDIFMDRLFGTRKVLVSKT